MFGVQDSDVGFLRKKVVFGILIEVAYARCHLIGGLYNVFSAKS